MKSKTKLLNLLREVFKIPLFEKFLRSKTQHKSSNSFWVKLIPNNYQYSFGSMRVAEQNGINFELDISDLVDWHLYFGIRETAQEQLFKLCKPGDTVIDVGANIGKVLLNISTIIGENGQVIGFEPDNVNYNKCMKNIGLNKQNNIQLFNLGLGNKEGELTMIVKDEHNRGMNRIIENPDKEGSTKHTIKIKTFDSLCSSLALTKLDVIKIDVEGFEYNVLRGADAALQKFHPALFIELDDSNLRQQSASALKLIALLKTYNYCITNADTGKELTDKDDYSNCHYDIICKEQK